MKFSSAVVERIKQQFLLSQVVSRTVRLRKAGRNYSGLCPFHNEKTPSFSVNDEKAFYHCFGCGAHGDVISFVMNTEGLSYPEAVEKLAAQAGLRIEKRVEENRPQIETANRQLELLEETARQYELQLHTPGGAKAREYLEKRGVPESIARIFRIGYAYDSYGSLKNHLLARHYNIEDAKVTGVVSVSDNGDVYDRFRGRLIFPITNSKSKVIGFGGRVLDDSLPKYLNSPETPYFKKGETLYGLDQARKSIYQAGRAIVVEGYLDVISLHQHGAANAVAPLGTALTRNHLELLWRITRDIVVCLDGDTAGQNAMFRTAETAVECITPGHEIYFAVMPSGYDPDIYIRKFGAEKFTDLIKNSANLAECLWRKYADMAASGIPGRKAEAEKELNFLADKIKDPLLKKHFRSFFSSRIWQAGREVGGKEVVVKSRKFNPALTSDSEILMAAAMFRIIKKFPDLLYHAEVESAISSLHFTEKQPEAVRHKIEEAMFSHSPEVVAALRLGFDAQAEKFAESLAEEAESFEEAKELLGRIIEDLTRIIGEKGRKQMLSGFAGDVTEEDWQKFLALHSLNQQ